MAEEPIPVTLNGEDDAHGPFLNEYFKATIKMLVSDPHLKTGEPPAIGMRGGLRALRGGPLTHEQVCGGVFGLLTPKQRELFDVGPPGDADGFPVNVFQQSGKMSLAARCVNKNIASYDTGMVDFTEHLRGLVQKRFVDHQTADQVVPNPDELKMALTETPQQIAGILP